MMQTFVLWDELANRQLHAFLRANWLACAQQGKPLAVTVSEHKARRTSEQNRLLWSLLREISAAAWVGGRQFADEAWHEFFKRKFIGMAELPHLDEALQAEAMGPLPKPVLARLDALYASDFGRV